MDKKNSNYHHQSRLIVIFSALAIFFFISIATLSLSYFSDVDIAWQQHSEKATEIADIMSKMNQYIGYGGFIHNFKNLVLRRDLARYQHEIEQNIAGFRAQLLRLDKILQRDEDKAQITLIRTVFESYVDNYKKISILVANGASSEAIDKVVKVDDAPALKAFSALNARTKERALQTEKAAQQAYDTALEFALLGDALILVTNLAAVIAILLFVRRLIAVNKEILLTQQRLDILLDTAPDPMLSVAANGVIVRANQMAENFFGYSNTQLLNMTVEQLIPQRYRPAHPEQRDGYFKASHNCKMGSGVALTALTHDGREPKVEISLSHSGSGAEKLATVTLRDITEQENNKNALIAAKQEADSALDLQRKMQRELVQAEKLAALGGLVASVAHDVNTPIGVTLSAATHLASETAKTLQNYQAEELSAEGLAEYFETAQEATRLMHVNIQRASELIQSFKQIAVDQTGGERRKFELKSYIDELLLSLRPLMKKSKIDVRVDCAEKLMLDTFPGPFSQVLTNLIKNALVHAFEPQQSGCIGISVSPKGEQLEIAFVDNGKGIPEQLHKQVFEPFFTTRRGAGGSGLGLHIVYTIVTQSLKGSLSMQSIIGQGTTFTLSLPQKLPD